MALGVGRNMITTPPKPIATAVHRRHPTCSPNIGTAMAVIINGPAYKMEAASAMGSGAMLASKLRRKKELMVMNAALKIQHKQMTGSTVGR